MEKKETFKCFVYGEEVTIIDGVCQEDCSVEECNLNRDNNQLEKKQDRQDKDDES